MPVLAAWNDAFGGLGLPALPQAELSRVLGPSTQLSAPELLAERGRDDAAAYGEFIDLFRASITEAEVEQAVAYPGIVEVLRALRDAGRRLSIVTAKPMQSAARVVPALGIAELFDAIYAPDLVAPEPKHVTMGRALAELRLGPDETVLVGDRFHDVEAASAHGVATIGVVWATHASRDELEGAGAAVVVATPSELRALLLPDSA